MAETIIKDIESEIEDCCKAGETYIGYNISDKELDKDSDILANILRILHDAGYTADVLYGEDVAKFININWS